MKRLIFLSILVFTLLLSACGGSSGLTVTDVWARPGNADGNSAIYFVVTPGSQADTLLSANSDVAMMVELHESTMAADGTMMMNQQENVPIPTGSKFEFKPGGFHVMLMGLKNDLKVGDMFKATLKFEKAGEITVDVTVREP
jgi:periplasmic copper chaperone A